MTRVGTSLGYVILLAEIRRRERGAGPSLECFKGKSAGTHLVVVKSRACGATAVLALFRGGRRS